MTTARSHRDVGHRRQRLAERGGASGENHNKSDVTRPCGWYESYTEAALSPARKGFGLGFGLMIRFNVTK